MPKGTRITVSSVIQIKKKKQLTIPLPNATALLLNSSACAFHKSHPCKTLQIHPVKTRDSDNILRWKLLDAVSTPNLESIARRLTLSNSLFRFTRLSKAASISIGNTQARMSSCLRHFMPCL